MQPPGRMEGTRSPHVDVSLTTKPAGRGQTLSRRVSREAPPFSRGFPALAPPSGVGGARACGAADTPTGARLLSRGARGSEAPSSPPGAWRCFVCSSRSRPLAQVPPAGRFRLKEHPIRKECFLLEVRRTAGELPSGGGLSAGGGEEGRRRPHAGLGCEGNAPTGASEGKAKRKTRSETLISGVSLFGIPESKGRRRRGEGKRFGESPRWAAGCGAAPGGETEARGVERVARL